MSDQEMLNNIPEGWVCRKISAPQVEPLNNVVEDVVLKPGKWEITKASSTENGGAMWYRLNCAKEVLTEDYAKNTDGEVLATLHFYETTHLDFILRSSPHRCYIDLFSLDAKHAKVIQISEAQFQVRFEDLRWRASDEQIWDDIIIEITQTEVYEPEVKSEETKKEEQEQMEGEENGQTPPVVVETPVTPTEEKPVEVKEPEKAIEAEQGKYQIKKVYSDAMVTGRLALMDETGKEEEICANYLALKDGEVIKEVSFDRVEHIKPVIYPMPTAEQVHNNPHLESVKSRVSSDDLDSIKLEKTNATDYKICFEDGGDSSAPDYNDLILEFVKIS